MKLKGYLKRITALSAAVSMLVCSSAYVYADTPEQGIQQNADAAGYSEQEEEITEEPEADISDHSESVDPEYTEKEDRTAEAADNVVPAGDKDSAGEKESAEDKDSAGEKESAGDKDSAGEKESAEDKDSDGDKKPADEKVPADEKDPDDEEPVADEEEMEAPTPEYSVLTGNDEEGYTYIIKFSEEDRVYESAVLKTENEDGVSLTEGQTIGNFALFSLSVPEKPLSVRIQNGTMTFEIDLALLEKEKLEETVEGYLADSSQKGKLYADAPEEEQDEISSEEAGAEEAGVEELVMTSEELSAEMLESALGAPVLSNNTVVMIDPGHGGSDPGACWVWEGVNIHEADINLALSKLLQKELAKYGITAYLTREDDYYILWEERVRKAAECGAALLASVHIDTAGGKAPYANGVSIFQAKIFDGSFNQENAEKGQELAKRIIDELVNIGFGKQPPVFIEEITNSPDVNYPGYDYADSYKIIRYGQLYNVPSVIIEHGFLDSEHDYYTYLCNDTVRQKVAAADAKAIAGYLGVGTTVSEKPGWHTNAAGRYYITKKGKMVHGWKTIGKYTYYFDDEGYVVTGTPVINGAKYWFDTKGRQKTGWLSLSGMNLYFSKKTGKCLTNGKYKISGKYYLFNQDGVRYENGTPIFKGKKYYAKNGVLQSGWLILSGMKLYFKKSDLSAAKGFTKISEKTYYFNKDGVLQVSKFITRGGKRYYTKSSGVIASGWRTINGKRYYFDPNNGNAAVTGGWKEVNGKKCYFTSKGVQYTGFSKIGKYTYYLYKKGGFATGTPIISGKKYYFTTKGRQKTGWINLAGMKLYFDPNNNGAAVVNNTITLDGITYRFNEDGVLVGQSNSYVTATDTNGVEYVLEGTYLSDPQIGKDVTENQFFASVVYAECGSEDYYAQVACAMVILNRMNTAGFPDSLPFVVYKKDQFAVARIEGDQKEAALTRYLKAYRDNDTSVLQYIENAQTMKAVKAAKKIMQAHKDTGADRYIKGYPYNNGETDFKCLYFMTPGAFERLGLDYEKTNAVTCTSQRTGASTVFFDVWIKKS